MARYRIKAVSAETGVPAPTLRSWELRYGVPIPQRSQAAYRLYSAADVQAIIAMRDWCAAGVAASEAARRVRAAAAGVPLPAAPDSTVTQRRLLKEAQRMDVAAWRRELKLVLAAGVPADAYDSLIHPLLERIGTAWAQGKLSVAHEHLATQALQEILSETLGRIQPTVATHRVLLACFDEEQHVLGLYGVALRLAAWGIKPVLLGARVPPIALAAAVRRLCPDGVGLSMAMRPHQPRAARLLASYAQAVGHTPWVVGGPGAAGLAQQIARHGGTVVLGQDTAALRAWVNHLGH